MSRKAEILSVDVDDFSAVSSSVGLVEAHARLEGGNVQNDIVEHLIRAAVKRFEDYTDSLLFRRNVTIRYLGGGYKMLLKPPVREIISVEDEDGNSLEYDFFGNIIAGSYYGRTTVVYEAGLINEGDDIPPDILTGILKYVTTNYDDRQNTVLEGVAEMPNDSKSHWSTYINHSL